MNRIVPLFLLGSASASAQASSYTNFIRQTQQATGIVWDMSVVPIGTASSALMLDNIGALFQLWTINQTTAASYLLDQKLVGVYLPVADVQVTTLDPFTKVHRTRVDKPFNVQVTISGLLTGPNLPLAATEVLYERHLGSYDSTLAPLNPVTVTSNTPFSSAYLTTNGITVLNYPVSALTAANPLKACGEEYFVIHALSDGSFTQTQIASGFVQVWPVATGSITGITPGTLLRFQMPQIELLLNDLYPRSDTYLFLYKGGQVGAGDGILVTAFPMDRDTSESHVIEVSNLYSMFTDDGTYTLGLVSDTAFGRDLLDSVTFSVNRTLNVNAMQVDYADDSTH